jgi:hypothetical protein
MKARRGRKSIAVLYMTGVAPVTAGRLYQGLRYIEADQEPGPPGLLLKVNFQALCLAPAYRDSAHSARASTPIVSFSMKR